MLLLNDNAWQALLLTEILDNFNLAVLNHEDYLVRLDALASEATQEETKVLAAPTWYYY
jgi:hypothetical protein